MRERKIFGWSLFTCALIFGLAEMGFWTIAALLGSSPDLPSKGFWIIIVVVVVTLLIITAIVMLGGWYLAHPTRGGKIRKPLGWVMLFLGFIGIPFFVYWLYVSAKFIDIVFGAYFVLLLYFCMIFIGGWVLVLRGAEGVDMQSKPQPSDEPTEEP